MAWRGKQRGGGIKGVRYDIYDTRSIPLSTTVNMAKSDIDTSSQQIRVRFELVLGRPILVYFAWPLLRCVGRLDREWARWMKEMIYNAAIIEAENGRRRC